MDNRAVEDNVRIVRDHYNRFFDMLDRNKTLSAAGWEQRPPIVNLGFWARGAKTSREAQEHFVHELATCLPALKGKQVLDVGCGLGGPATILAGDYGAQVDGITIVEQQVKWARNYIGGNKLQDRVRVHLGSAMDIPFHAESFDVAFSLEAAHCFIDKPRFLAEVWRVLRPGGTFLLTDIIGCSGLPLLRWQPALKLYLATRSEWAKMIRSVGFTIEKEHLIGSSVYPGFRASADQTAGERRQAIFNRICSDGAWPPIRQLRRLQAWAVEFAYCRSVLKLGSRLKLREYVLFVAHK